MASHGHSHGGGGCCGDDHGHASAAVVDTPQDGLGGGSSTSHADLPLLRPSKKQSDSLPAEFLRAESLYHHIVDGTPIAECGAGSGAEAGAASPSPADGEAGPLPHDNDRHTRDALAAFLRCADMIRREGVFSANESLVDIQTNSLQYLLVEFYIACLRQRAPVSSAPGHPGDMARSRLHALKSAKDELEGFLAQVISIRGLVPADEAKAIGLADMAPHLAAVSGRDLLGNRSLDSGRLGKASNGGEEDDRDLDYSTGLTRAGKSTSSISISPNDTLAKAMARTGLASSSTAPALRSDPAAMRAQKIERFKRNAAATKRLRELAAANARAVEAARKRGMNDAEAIEEAQLDGIGASLGGPTMDEGAKREMVVLTIQSAVRQALDDLASMAQELPLLMHMAASAPSSSSKAPASASSAADDARVSDREKRAGAAGSGSGFVDFSGRSAPPAGDPSIDPNRKGIEVQRIDPTMTVTREVIRAEVFTNPFPGPSMTMEEWGDIVTEKRVAKEAREAKQAEARGKTYDMIMAEGLEGEGSGGVSEADFDKATEHKRRMDDWKDLVPKGSGNTKRI